MARLSERDYVAVLRAVHEISASTSPDSFAPLALRELNGLVRSDVSSLNEIDPAAGRLVFVAEPDTFRFPPEGAQTLAALAAEHPLIRHVAETGDGSAVKISDVTTLEAWHGSEIFRRLYEPMGIEHQMSITLPAPRPIVVGLALNRAEGDFGERDRAVLNLIRPHLAQTWRRAREYQRLRQLVEAAGGALAADGSGVIVLSDPLHELTPGALVALYRFFGRPTPRDPLPARVRRWLDAQHDHTPGHSGELGLSRPLRGVLHDRQLVLRHLPGARDHPDALLLDERPVDAAPTTLRGVGLTEREAAVLDLVGTGATNAEIAQQLSLSPWTVKRHLANVYAKLGVHGRLRASALALEITAHHARDSTASLE